MYNDDYFIFTIFFSNLFVLFYSIQKVGAGTNANLALTKSEKIKTMKPVRDREYTVHFAADTHSLMKWNFKPSQKAVSHWYCF